VEIKLLKQCALFLSVCFIKVCNPLGNHKTELIVSTEITHNQNSTISDIKIRES